MKKAPTKAPAKAAAKPSAPRAAVKAAPALPARQLSGSTRNTEVIPLSPLAFAKKVQEEDTIPLALVVVIPLFAVVFSYVAILS